MASFQIDAVRVAVDYVPYYRKLIADEAVEKCPDTHRIFEIGNVSNAPQKRSSMGEIHAPREFARKWEWGDGRMANDKNPTLDSFNDMQFSQTRIALHSVYSD